MKRQKNTKLTILIGTCNRLSLLKNCLSGIIRSTKIPYQIYLFDTGSKDGTLDFIKIHYPQIKLVNDKKRLGQAKSFNQVLHRINTPYICWLSDDNFVKKGILDKVVRILESESNIGMVALKVKDMSGPWVDEPYIGGIWPSGILNINQGMVRTEILKQVKYFDPSYPDYGIDSDLTTKILLAGYSVVYTKDVCVYHYRDYYSYPGAFVQNDRKSRLVKALRIYRNKYSKLCRSSRKKRDRTISDFTLEYILQLFFFLCSVKLINIYMQLHTGYNRRDFYNVLHARFVSKFDLWYNRKKSYYLVQYIPKLLRK